MARPLDAITAFHNAFRRDIALIDAAAVALARGHQEASQTLDRFRFFNEMLVWHADGEEAATFPLLERLDPLLPDPYIQDHHGLDAANETLNAAVEAADQLETARATAAFKFFLNVHLNKEDRQVYPLLAERIPLDEQKQAVGTMSGMVPRERFPEVIAWIFPLLGPLDRQNLVQVFQMLMPPEVFAPVKGLIQGVVGDDDWAALSRVLSG
jgi:hemerythrin-like domain-containing protein